MIFSGANGSAFASCNREWFLVFDSSASFGFNVFAPLSLVSSMLFDFGQLTHAQSALLSS
jgi:hypothetical protein